MRGLEAKVSLNRSIAPIRAEHRRQRIISALIISTFPVLEITLNYFVLTRRYDIKTLVGCNTIYFSSWIYLIFYILPIPVFMVGASFRAGKDTI